MYIFYTVKAKYLSGLPGPKKLKRPILAINSFKKVKTSRIKKAK